jgi:aminoglycoside 3-N-acetyltransferase
LSARQRSLVREKLIFRYGTFTADQLVAECRSAGIRANSVLFVQCSFNDLLTYGGTSYALLNALRELAGPFGTLLMPAYSTNMQSTPCRPFDVRYEPTSTGIIPELFRREDGVIRSLHPRHSLCALGPRAKELLAGHENCLYADGLDSPFDRLRRLDAQSLCLGMAPGFTSFIHWVEDIEPEKYPIKTHDGPYECVLTDESGEEIHRLFYRRAAGQKKREAHIGRNLTSESMRKLNFHGAPVCIYSWPALADELLSLRDRGIVYYT